MPRISPRPRHLLLLFAVLAIVLAGCTGTAETDPTATAPAASGTQADSVASPPAATAPATPATPTPSPTPDPDDFFPAATPQPATPQPVPIVQASPFVMPDVPTAAPIDDVPQTPEQEAASAVVAYEYGVYGYVVLEQDGSVVASINGTTPFITASTYKLILMADILWRIESGMYALDDTLVLTQENFGYHGDMYFGSGAIGSAYTIEEYLFATGAWSSNAAARTLLGLTSPEVLRLTAMLIGMEQTQLFVDPEQLDLFLPATPAIDAPPEEVELAREYLAESALEAPVSVTTPLDMARYQLGLINGTLISPWVSEQIIGILERQAIRDRIPYHYDGWIRTVNKPGDLPDAANDVGVIYLPEGPRAVAMLSQAVPSRERAVLVERNLALIASGETAVPPLP